MGDSFIFDVVVGLCTLYFLLSIICSVLTELTSLFFSKRARTLSDAINGILAESRRGGASRSMAISLADFYDHGLVQALKSPRPFSRHVQDDETRKRPAYIPPEVFSRVLVDLVARSRANEGAEEAGYRALPASTSELMTYFYKGVERMPDVPLKGVLAVMLAEARDDYESLRRQIERWYDQTMDVARGRYKAWTMFVIAGWAAIICSVANVDMVAMTRVLSADREARQQIAAVAVDIAKTPGPDAVPGERASRIDIAMDALERTGLPLGWRTRPSTLSADLKDILTKIVGLALSVAAVSAATPFWFDMLNKLVNIRLSSPSMYIPMRRNVYGLTSIGMWSEALNARRHELIDKDEDEPLSAKESAELVALQRAFEAYRRRTAPVPISELRRFKSKEQD